LRHGLKAQCNAHQVTRFVGSGNVAGFILYPELAAGRRYLRSKMELLLAGSSPKSAPVNVGHHRIEPLHAIHVFAVTATLGPGQSIRKQQSSIADEGIRVLVKLYILPRQLQPQNVFANTIAVGTSERPWRESVNGGAAGGATKDRRPRKGAHR
jgi:hypothetical protein